MPAVDLEEPVKPVEDVVADPTAVVTEGADDTAVATEGEGQDDALTRGLEGLDPTLEGAEPKPAEDAPPAGVTVDDKGRWRSPDGTFAPKQPTVEAAKSARDERAQLQRVAEYKAKGLDARGIKPWTPNVFGKEMPLIPTAQDKPGVGVLIPESGRAALTMLVARGHRWQEIQAQRQEQASAIQREQERAAFFSSEFEKIVTDTLLNPEWFEWAGTDAKTFETAKMQVQARLRAAAVDGKEKFGAIPTKEERGEEQPEPIDAYEAEAAFEDFLDEIIQAEPATFAGLDKPAVRAEVLRLKPPIWVRTKDGPLLDTRPVRIIAENVALRSRATARPAVDPAANRNKAAVATTTPLKPAVPARPKVTTTPSDPKSDPRYAGHEQDNPALDLDARRAAYYKNLGIRMPG